MSEKRDLFAPGEWKQFPGYNTLLPEDVHVPGKVKTSLGKLKNEDGSVDLYFGPEVPEGWESNWAQTVPGKGWFVLFHIYGPLEPWFGKSWKLNDFERVS